MPRRNGVTLDAKKGEARFGEDHRRMVLISSEAFVKMMEALNAFDTVGFTMFYMMGQEKGYCDVSEEIEALRQQRVYFTKRQVMENVVHQVRVTGWGASRVQKYDEKRGALTILVENNPLVVGLRTDGKSDRPVRHYLARARLLCHFFRGYWVAVVSKVLERKVSCAETKCVGMGDPYCEFKITAQ